MNEIVPGVFRKKHQEVIYAATGFLIGAVFDQLRALVPPPHTIQEARTQVAIFLAMSSLFIFCLASYLYHCGTKTLEAGKFPYPGKFCLVDTIILVDEAATKRGNDYRKAAGITMLLFVGIMAGAEHLFHLYDFFNGNGPFRLR